MNPAKSFIVQNQKIIMLVKGPKERSFVYNIVEDTELEIQHHLIMVDGKRIFLMKVEPS